MTKEISDLAAEYAATHTDVARAWMDGYNAAMAAALPIKRHKKELDLLFVAPDYIYAVNRWIQYKKERKNQYTQMGVESMYKKLVQISGGNPEIALAIVEQSIANNWQGLFKLKDEQANITRQHKRTDTFNGRRNSVDELAELASALLCGNACPEPRQGYN